MAFTLPKLDYAFDALEPYIDAKTIEIHYTKHHGGYTDKLNSALASEGIETRPILEIISNVSEYVNAFWNIVNWDEVNRRLIG